MFREEQRKTDGGESLERIHKKNRVTPPFSENAEDIRCSDVTAPE